MPFNDILVKELREEHRDREWVDQNRVHWIWCEDAWMSYDLPSRPYINVEWQAGDPNDASYQRWPFMEAMHARLLGWG